MTFQYLFEVASSFASSPCVLVLFQVASASDLKTVIEFGRRAVQLKRVGLVLKLAGGVQLGGLPFMTSALRGEGGIFKSRHSKQP